MELGLYVHDPSQQDAIDSQRTRAEIRGHYDSVIAQRQQEIDFAGQFLDNIGELKGQTEKLHRDIINEEIDQLYNDANEGIVKRNKKGKVVGLNVNNPEFKTEVRNRVQRIGMMNDRSAKINTAMEAYAKAEEKNEFLNLTPFYEDLVRTASSPELLAMDSDIDSSFKKLVEKHDNPQLRAKKFIASNSGASTAGFRQKKEGNRLFSETLEGKVNYHNDKGEIREDIVGVLGEILTNHGDGRLNNDLVKQYQNQLRLDPIATPDIKDPMEQAAYMISKQVPSASLKKRDDITDNEVNSAIKKATLDKKNEPSGDDEKTEWLTNWVKLFQQPKGPAGTEEEVRISNKQAVGMLTSTKNINEAHVFTNDQAVDWLKNNSLGKDGYPITIPGVDKDKKRVEKDITNAEDDEIRSFFNITSNSEHAIISYKVGTKDTDIIDLGDPDSFGKLMVIGEENLPEESLRALFTGGEEEKADDTVYTFQGEEYTLSHLREKYGNDWNPEDYEGFSKK